MARHSMNTSGIESFVDIQTTIDEEIWKLASNRSTPALRSAREPEADNCGIDAVHVAKIVTAFAKSTFDTLRFQAHFTCAADEIEAGWMPAWAQQHDGETQVFFLVHSDGRCGGEKCALKPMPSSPARVSSNR